MASVRSAVIRAIDAGFAVVLLTFAAIQWNDPDPWFWIILYLLCGIGPLLTLFRPIVPAVFWIALAFAAAGLVASFGGALEYLSHLDESLMQEMSADKPYIEEAREFLGALIAVSLICVHFVVHRGRSDND